MRGSRENGPHLQQGELGASRLRVLPHARPHTRRVHLRLLRGLHPPAGCGTLPPSRPEAWIPFCARETWRGGNNAGTDLSQRCPCHAPCGPRARRTLVTPAPDPLPPAPLVLPVRGPEWPLRFRPCPAVRAGTQGGGCSPTQGRQGRLIRPPYFLFSGALFLHPSFSPPEKRGKGPVVAPLPALTAGTGHTSRPQRASHRRIPRPMPLAAWAKHQRLCSNIPGRKPESRKSCVWAAPAHLAAKATSPCVSELIPSWLVPLASIRDASRQVLPGGTGESARGRPKSCSVQVLLGRAGAGEAHLSRGALRCRRPPRRYSRCAA
jgi:hypothetical protein